MAEKRYLVPVTIKAALEVTWRPTKTWCAVVLNIHGTEIHRTYLQSTKRGAISKAEEWILGRGGRVGDVE